MHLVIMDCTKVVNVCCVTSAAFCSSCTLQSRQVGVKYIVQQNAAISDRINITVCLRSLSEMGIDGTCKNHYLYSPNIEPCILRCCNNCTYIADAQQTHVHTVPNHEQCTECNALYSTHGTLDKALVEQKSMALMQS